jgi:ubiquitin carboxyl-terminal hydrolase 5/13
MDDEEPAPAGGSADPENIAMLEGMGFTAEKAKAALAACDNNMERAVEWLFSHMDEDVAPAQDDGAAASDSLAKGEYELVGFLSHMGKNTGCGHYVCHIKKVCVFLLYFHC